MLLPGEDLCLSDLPDEDASFAEVLDFVREFDGYNQAGGFHEAAEISRDPDLNSITEMRVAMFFSVRAMRHCDIGFGEQEQARFRGYIERIRAILRGPDIDFDPHTCRTPESKDDEMPTTPSTKKVSFGGCDFAKASPKLENLSAATKILNVTLSFEDALKLNLAIDECVRKLNSYKRSTTAGKRSALNLAIHLDKGRVTINEGKI